MFQIFRRVLGLSSSTSTKRSQRTKPRRQFQPRVEALETREVPAATLAKDVFVGPNSSMPQELVQVNTRVGPILYFTADDGFFGRELWQARVQGNGQVVTNMVKDIFPGPTGSDPQQLTEVGKLLYFSADNGVNGRELWVTDGTQFGTRMVEDINPGSASSDPGELTAFVRNPKFDASKSDGSETRRLYFAATHNQSGRELWTSFGQDVKIVDAKIVRDINPGLADSAPSYLTVAKVRQRGTLFNVLYLAADRVGLGRELWRTTPNGQDAFLVKDIRGGPDGSNPFNLTKVTPRNSKNPDILFFGANDGFHGAELWGSRGSFGTTTLVRDINAGGPDSDSLEESPTTLRAEFKHQLFFAADDGFVGRELWRSNGRFGGTVRVRDINPGPNSSNPTAQDHPLPRLRNLIVRQGEQDRLLLFGATDGLRGSEPWRTNGNMQGTIILKDINVGPADSLVQNELIGIVFPSTKPGDPSKPATTQRFYFAADDGFLGRELWVGRPRFNNGIPVDVSRDTDINVGPPPSDPSDFEISGGFVFFAAEKALLGRELWQVRG